MTGYRERDQAPPPPLTWTQRVGIACLFVGAGIVFVYIAGRLRLIPPLIDSPVPGTAAVAIAAPLVAARRGPLSAETKRQRLIIIAVALAVLAAAIATIFVIKGA